MLTNYDGIVFTWLVLLIIGAPTEDLRLLVISTIACLSGAIFTALNNKFGN
jgi:hypothetical protein